MNKFEVAHTESTRPLAEVVYEKMVESIYQGKLPPGSVVNEVALAQEFGVSRGPIREAMHRLQGIQLVTREPYMKARVVSMSAEAALELFQLRAALEGMACRLATQRMADVEINTLLADLEQDYLHKKTALELPRAFDFHERIVRACGNSRIIGALCGDLYHLLRIYRRHSGSVPERREDAYAEHWQILRALQTRDAALAESLMRSHIERASAHLSAHLVPERASDPVAQPPLSPPVN